MSDTTLALALAALHTELDDETVEFFVGRKYLSRHEQPRRVVWIPRPSPIEPPKDGGAGLSVDGTRRISNCCVRVDTALAVISDTDAGDVDALFSALLAAYYRVTPLPLQPGPFEWITEQDDKAGETVRGAVIACPFQFRMSVPVEQMDLTVIATQEHTCNIVFDLT